MKRLRFRLAQNLTLPDVPFVEFTMPMDRTSLAGYTAVTGEPLVIDDAYFLPPDVEYTINRSFDERYGYRTKSMLVIPMKDHKEADHRRAAAHQPQARLQRRCSPRWTTSSGRSCPTRSGPSSW